MSYRPEQRQVVSQVMTQAGWLQATLHVPRASMLSLHINSQQDFFKVTNVSLMGKQAIMPFMSIQRKRVVLIVPPAEESEPTQGAEGQAPQEIFVLLEGGVISGTIYLRKGVRVSDFFSRQQGFVVLHNCLLQLGALNENLFVEERHATVLVNTSQMIGVSESHPLQVTR